MVREIKGATLLILGPFALNFIPKIFLVTRDRLKRYSGSKEKNVIQALAKLCNIGRIKKTGVGKFPTLLLLLVKITSVRTQVI